MAANIKKMAREGLKVNVGANTVSSGDPIVVGSLTGVAQSDKNSDDEVVLLHEKVAELEVVAKSTGSGTKATTSIGSGANGTVDLEVDQPGTDGNNWSIEIVDPGSNDAALSVDVDARDITVTLGTGGAGALDDAKNTATLVAAALNDKLGGLVTATASGDGSSAIISDGGGDDSVAEVSFTGGAEGSETNHAVLNGDKLYIDAIGGSIRPDASHGELIGKAYSRTAVNNAQLIAAGSTDSIWVMLQQ